MQQLKFRFLFYNQSSSDKSVHKLCNMRLISCMSFIYFYANCSAIKWLSRRLWCETRDDVARLRPGEFFLSFFFLFFFFLLLVRFHQQESIPFNLYVDLHRLVLNRPKVKSPSYFACSVSVTWRSHHLYTCVLITLKSGWPLFQKYFSGLQRKSVSNFYTLHHKILFWTKNDILLTHIFVEMRENTHKIRKFVFFFLISGLRKIIPGFLARCDFSGPARKFSGHLVAL